MPPEQKSETTTERIGRPGDPCVMVIFGASGDLTRRKLIPALYNLGKNQLLSQEFAVIGVAKDAMTTEDFRAKLKQDLQQFADVQIDANLEEWFQRRMYYLTGDFGSTQTFQQLKELLQKMDTDHGTHQNYFYYLAIQRTNVATAIILQYTAPVWVLLYTVLRGGYKPSMRRSAAVGLAVFGCILAVGFVGSGGLSLDPVGVTAALLAAFSFAFYNVGGHSVLARYDRWKVLLWVLLSAATFWIFVNPPWKIWAAHFSREQWGFMLIFSLVSVLGPFSCYFAGLQHLEPTRAVVASCLEPVFSILIAAVALGELLRPLQTVGIVVVLIAIVLIQWPEREARQAELLIEPIE